MRVDWFESSEKLAEHSARTNEAVAKFKAAYPDLPVDITRAQAEYAQALGLPPDYFRLVNTWTPAKLARFFDGRLDCPHCRRKLGFEAMFGCPRSNPSRFTGLFFCEDELCPYYFFTTEGLLDVRNKVNRGDFDQVVKVITPREGLQ